MAEAYVYNMAEAGRIKNNHFLQKYSVDPATLINKISDKISTGYSKQLSYAGRLQVIVDVLFSIHNFWGMVLIQPQSVLKKVDRRCRMFLWGQ